MFVQRHKVCCLSAHNYYLVQLLVVLWDLFDQLVQVFDGHLHGNIHSKSEIAHPSHTVCYVSHQWQQKTFGGTWQTPLPFLPHSYGNHEGVKLIIPLSPMRLWALHILFDVCKMAVPQFHPYFITLWTKGHSCILNHTSIHVYTITDYYWEQFSPSRMMSRDLIAPPSVTV